MNDTHAFSMKRSSGASKVPFPSPRVQSLQRPSILCNPRLVFFSDESCTLKFLRIHILVKPCHNDTLENNYDHTIFDARTMFV